MRRHNKGNENARRTLNAAFCVWQRNYQGAANDPLVDGLFIFHRVKDCGVPFVLIVVWFGVCLYRILKLNGEICCGEFEEIYKKNNVEDTLNA